jgi:hypothetical protein
VKNRQNRKSKEAEMKSEEAKKGLTRRDFFRRLAGGIAVPLFLPSGDFITCPSDDKIKTEVADEKSRHSYPLIIDIEPVGLSPGL